MKILAIHNDHIKESKSEREYGCICNKCGTVFIFKRSEAYIPRYINAKPEICYIKCPNCQKIITLDKCKEFKTLKDKDEFKHKYDE